MPDSFISSLPPILDIGGDVIPVEAAAQSLGIEAKRLRGFIARNGIADPIGNMQWVYPWSLEPLRKRLADHADGVRAK